MIWSYLAYWVGAIADWYTTKEMLADGGRELNGFVRRLIEKLPWSTELEIGALKLIVFGVMWWADVPAWGFYTVGGVYFIAGVGNRLRWWGKLRGMLS